LSAGSKSYFSLTWLNNQPYLLLSLASLFFAGNIVLARYVAGHVPPLTLTCMRWIGVFLFLLPFAKDHPAARLVVSVTARFAARKRINCRLRWNNKNEWMTRMKPK
jgi:drug/metabolite transporter (DMT)-like permease